MKIVKLDENIINDNVDEKVINESVEIDESVLSEDASNGIKFPELAQAIGSADEYVPDEVFDAMRKFADRYEIGNGSSMGVKSFRALSQEDKEELLGLIKDWWDAMVKKTPSVSETTPIDLNKIPDFAIEYIDRKASTPFGAEFAKGEYDAELIPEASNINSVLDNYYATNIHKYWMENYAELDDDEVKELIDKGEGDKIVNYKGTNWEYIGPNEYQHANVVFVGPPGAGKSAVIKSWLKSHQIPNITMTGSNLTRYIVNGLPASVEDKTINTKHLETGGTVYSVDDAKHQEYLRSTVFDALQSADGSPTVLFIDELNRTDDKATASLLSLLQDKSVYDPNTGGMSTSRKLTTFLFTIAAMNDNDMTDPLSNAMADRFSFVYAKSSAKETFDYWDDVIDGVNTDEDNSNEVHYKKNGFHHLDAKKKKLEAMGKHLSSASFTQWKWDKMRKSIIETLRENGFEFIDYDGGDEDEFSSLDSSGDVKGGDNAVTALTPGDLTTKNITSSKSAKRILSARGFGTALMNTHDLGDPNKPRNNDNTFLGEIRKWCTSGQYEEICRILKPLYKLDKFVYSDPDNPKTNDTFKNAWEIAKIKLGHEVFEI